MEVFYSRVEPAKCTQLNCPRRPTRVIQREYKSPTYYCEVHWRKYEKECKESDVVLKEIKQYEERHFGKLKSPMSRFPRPSDDGWKEHESEWYAKRKKKRIPKWKKDVNDALVKIRHQELLSPIFGGEEESEVMREMWKEDELRRLGGVQLPPPKHCSTTPLPPEPTQLSLDDLANLFKS